MSVDVTVPVWVERHQNILFLNIALFYIFWCFLFLFSISFLGMSALASHFFLGSASLTYLLSSKETFPFLVLLSLLLGVLMVFSYVIWRVHIIPFFTLLFCVLISLISCWCRRQSAFQERHSDSRLTYKTEYSQWMFKLTLSYFLSYWKRLLMRKGRKILN